MTPTPPPRARPEFSVARLRDADPEDAPTLTALEEAINVAALPHIFPPERYPYPSDVVLARWGRELLDPTYRIRVAEVALGAHGTERVREHRVVGYCACRKAEGRVWLEHLGVAADAQGSGLAPLLVAEARNAYPGREMHLWVLTDNARARRFYEREGWVATGVEMPAVYPPYPPMVEYVASA